MMVVWFGNIILIRISTSVFSTSIYRFLWESLTPCHFARDRCAAEARHRPCVCPVRSDGGRDCDCGGDTLK